MKKDEIPAEPFPKGLLGKRVAIANFIPEEPKVKKKQSKVLLLPNDQKAVDAKAKEDELVSTDRFLIIQVGSDCDPKLERGQEVDIEDAIRHLSPENSHQILKDSKIIAFIIPERVITGIY